MLQADKAHLEAWTRVNLLQIREKELRLYTQNNHNLGFVGTIVAGIAYFGLLYCRENVGWFNASPEWQKAIYGVSIIACLGISLNVCFATTLAVMLGPGTALRTDNNTTFHRAVEGMRIEYENAAAHLILGVHASMLMVVAYAWGAAAPHWLASVLVSAMALAFSGLIFRQVSVLDKAFPIRSIELTSGAFHSKRGARSSREGEESPPSAAAACSAGGDGGSSSPAADPPSPPAAKSSRGRNKKKGKGIVSSSHGTSDLL